MGTLWQYSLQISNIPNNKVEEIEKIVSEVFNVSIDIEENSIEIWDKRVYASWSFKDNKLDELKKRLWENEYIEFSCSIEVTEETIPETFDYEEYIKFKNNYIHI